MWRRPGWAHSIRSTVAGADRSEDKWREYFASMPWASVPWKHSTARSALTRMFRVMGIPAVAVIDPDGR